VVGGERCREKGCDDSVVYFFNCHRGAAIEVCVCGGVGGWLIVCVWKGEREGHRQDARVRA